MIEYHKFFRQFFYKVQIFLLTVQQTLLKMYIRVLKVGKVAFLGVMADTQWAKTGPLDHNLKIRNLHQIFWRC